MYQRISLEEFKQFITESDKVVVDDKVAVLYSPGHGAGWYSWHDKKGLLFDPRIIRTVLEWREKEDYEDLPVEKVKEIVQYCKKVYGSNYYEGARSLQVAWVQQGTQFRVDEYDGYESIETNSQIEWITA